MSVFISVVVAVYNPLKEHIGPCLKALGKLQYPHDSHEIIIVDDGSTAETTEECLTQLAPDERRRISYVKTAHAGHPLRTIRDLLSHVAASSLSRMQTALSIPIGCRLSKPLLVTALSAAPED